MKYFLVFALIATVASASYIKPTPVSAEAAQIQEIIAAIQSPSTDPATAAALEAMLFEVLGLKPEPIAVGPAIIEPEPIAVGPAIVEPEPVVIAPSPVIIGDLPEGSPAPLVQIIVNVNQAEAGVVGPAPAILPEIIPTPVHVVDSIEPTPVQVVEPVSPVQVVHPATPVQVVDSAPVAAEPVLVAVPVIPDLAVNIPGQLN